MFALRSPHNDDEANVVDGGSDDYDDDASPTYSSLSFQVLNAFRHFECLQLNSVNDSIINDGTINRAANARKIQMRLWIAQATPSERMKKKYTRSNPGHPGMRKFAENKYFCAPRKFISLDSFSFYFRCDKIWNAQMLYQNKYIYWL